MDPIHEEIARDPRITDELRIVHAVLHLAEQVVELRKQLHDDMTDLKGSIDRHR